MREQEFKVRDKKVHKMTRDGLVEENLTQGTQEKISSRLADASFGKDEVKDNVLGHRVTEKQQSLEGNPARKRKPERPSQADPSDEVTPFDHATAPQIWGPDNAPASMRDAKDKPMQTRTGTQHPSIEQAESEPFPQNHIPADNVLPGRTFADDTVFRKVNPQPAIHQRLKKSDQKEKQGNPEKTQEEEKLQFGRKEETWAKADLSRKSLTQSTHGRLRFEGKQSKEQPEIQGKETEKSLKKMVNQHKLSSRSRCKPPMDDNPENDRKQPSSQEDSEHHLPPEEPPFSGRLNFQPKDVLMDKRGQIRIEGDIPAKIGKMTAKKGMRKLRLRYKKDELPLQENPSRETTAKNAAKDISESASGNASKNPQKTKNTYIRQTPLEKAERKLHNANRKLEKAQEKLPDQRRIRLEKQYDNETGRVKHRLQFESEPPPESVTPSLPKRAGKALARTGRTFVSAKFHQKVREAEQDNLGVEAAHKTETAAWENGSRIYRITQRRMREKPLRDVQRTKKHVLQAEGNYAFQQFLEQNPEIRKTSFSLWLQKQKIKRQYAAAARKAKKTAQQTSQTVNTTGQLIRAAIQTVSAHRTMFGIVALAALLVILCGSLFTSCTAMLTGVQSAIISTCYTADDKDINDTELRYTQREAALQQDIRQMERAFPGYDEYRYNIGEIGHSPYELMGYLSAIYGSFTYAQAEPELERLFNQQYQLTRQTIVERRTYRDQDGDIHTYNWYVLKTTLTVRPLSEIIAASLTPGEQTERYQIYLQNGGNRQCYHNPFDFAWNSFLTNPYGYRINPATGESELHQGVDIGVPYGTAVKAALDGKVIFSGNDGENGLCVEVEGKNGYRFRYAHCAELFVHTGQEVSCGEEIAAVGTTGDSTTPHLHLEITHNGEPLNPCYFVANGSTSGSTSLPENPGEAMGDGTFVAMLTEAERYLGFPYVWGGSSPATSFDCSGYVSWVINHSGAGNVGRQTAQGLYNLCTPVSRAEMQPGDLVFFTRTYSTANPVTHVGIYIGGGRMIHCGDPISYANIDSSSYWLSHFYSGGRLP